MAKEQSLKKRIDALVDALGSAQKPTPTEIRNELFPIGVEVEALENSETLAEKDATIAALKEENENLNVALQTANAELETFRTEKKKREQENRDLPDDQFKILTALPSQSDGFAGGKSIAANLGLDTGDVDVHLSQLRELGYAFNVGYQWQRTIDGNRHIMAKRLAGEQEVQKARKYPDLPQTQHETLMTMKGTEEGVSEVEIAFLLDKKSAALIRHNLRLLKDAGMINFSLEPDVGDRWWYLTIKGEEYLAERELL